MTEKNHRPCGASQEDHVEGLERGASAARRCQALTLRSSRPRATGCTPREFADRHAFLLEHGGLLDFAGRHAKTLDIEGVAAHRRRRYMDSDVYLYIHDRIRN